MWYLASRSPNSRGARWEWTILILYLVSLATWNYTMIFIYIIKINASFYQLKMLMFYNAQTTNLTFVGKQWDIKYIVRVLCNPKLVVTLNQIFNCSNRWYGVRGHLLINVQNFKYWCWQQNTKACLTYSTLNERSNKCITSFNCNHPFYFNNTNTLLHPSL